MFIGDSQTFGGVTVFNNKVIVGADGALTVTDLKEPTVASDAATKFYVDTYINQGFAGEGVLYKGSTPNDFKTIPGAGDGGTEWAYNFLGYNVNTKEYSFIALQEAAAAITLLKISGASGITVTGDPGQGTASGPNPTVTDFGFLTVDVDVPTLRRTLQIDNVSNVSTTTILTDSTLSGNTTVANFTATGTSLLQGPVTMSSTLSVNGSVGTSGQFLSSTGTGLRWATLSANSISNGTSSVVVRQSSTVDISVGGNVVGYFDPTGLVGNASTVTNGVYTTGSYNNPSWITGLSVTQGGTGADTALGALTNLLPTGEQSGYVLKTTGRGNYY